MLTNKLYHLIISFTTYLIYAMRKIKAPHCTIHLCIVQCGAKIVFLISKTTQILLIWENFIYVKK